MQHSIIIKRVNVYLSCPKGGIIMAHIQKRGNSYRITVSCGYDENGKQLRRTKTWAPSQQMTTRQIEKELKKQEVMFEEECQITKYDSTTKFRDYAEKWFRSYAQHNLRERSIESYRQHTVRVYKALGDIQIGKISTQDITDFLNSLDEEGTNERNGKPLSRKTIKNFKAFISSVLHYAVRNDIIPYNKCIDAVVPKNARKAPAKEFYQPEEISEILNKINDCTNTNIKYVVYFNIAIYGGFRRGEILGLTWNDIDFDNYTIKISKAETHTKDGTYSGETKNESSIRCVKFNSTIFSLLQNYKQYQKKKAQSLGSKWINNDLLFTQWNGQPMDMNTPYNWFKKFCDKNNIRFLCPHSFRHFAAAYLIHQGYSIKQVQDFLGHSLAKTTLDTYAYLFKDKDGTSGAVVGNLIS